jgi:endonuclease/exonuclease/phosphatase family metal-dependent hydrolase
MGKEDETNRLWPARVSKIRNLIEETEPDFFGVQEAYKTQINDLLESSEIKQKYSWIGRGRKEGVPDEKIKIGKLKINIPLSDIIKMEGEHSSIFYRKDKFEKLDHGTFWLNKDKKEGKKGWGEPFNRICSWIKLQDKKNKKIIWVFNTHLAVKKEEAREKGLELILKEMKKKVKPGEVAFLTGDFNDKSLAAGSSLGKVIRNDYFPIFDTAELTDKKSGPEYTALTHDWKPGNKKIDFIAVNNKDRVEIISQCILSPKGNTIISDHLPVVVDFRIKEKKGD